ncbi:MAG: site-2 protease family protein [bacterium]
MVIWYVAFLLSFTAHEAAHAYAAMKGGDLTAYLGGQVSLNPIPHIERSPIGTVVVPLISYVWLGWMVGWASAPYDPSWARAYPRRAAWMAAAGPAANLLLFVLAFVVLKFGLSTGLFQTPEWQQLSDDQGRFQLTNIVLATGGVSVGVAKLLSVLFALNLILFIFNLFPFPPLDGSGIVTLFMSEQMAYRFTQFISQPMYSLLGIVIAWRLFGMVFWKIFVVAFVLLHYL